jgi:glycosyltransferase involved in cell wall biosynthesis
LLRRYFAGLAGNTHHAAAVAAELFSLEPAKVATVYNGIDWRLLQPERTAWDVRSELGFSNDIRLIGTSANLRDWKRVDLAIAAVAKLDATVGLVVIGDGPVRPALERLVQRLSMRERVRFVGMKDNVVDYLQVLDVFVLPSGPEESFGNAAVEALGLAIPTIVMRDGGGLVEHVRHNETGLIVGNVDELAEAIHRLCQSSSLRAALGSRAAVETRTRYTLEAMVDGYETLYAEGPDGCLRPHLRQTRRGMNANPGSCAVSDSP